MKNYYTRGRYFNGDEYFQKHETERDARDDVSDIQATDEYYRLHCDTNLQKQKAGSTVMFVGLQYVEEEG